MATAKTHSFKEHYLTVIQTSWTKENGNAACSGSKCISKRISSEESFNLPSVEEMWTENPSPNRVSPRGGIVSFVSPSAQSPVCSAELYSGIKPSFMA